MSTTLRPIRGLGQVVVYLLIAQIVLAVAEAIAFAHRVDIVQQLQDGGPFDIGVARAADNGVAVTAGLDLLVFIATGVLWCIWQYRAQGNAIEITGDGLQFTPGWAVGWWFIPVANLFKPFQAVRELWKASHGGDAWRTLRTWPVIGWWWAVWILSLVYVWFGENGGGVSIGTAPTDAPATPADVISGDKKQILSLALDLIAAVLAIKIVRAVVHAQETAPPRLTAMPAPPFGGALPDPPHRPDIAAPGSGQPGGTPST